MICGSYTIHDPRSFYYLFLVCLEYPDCKSVLSLSLCLYSTEVCLRFISLDYTFTKRLSASDRI